MPGAVRKSQLERAKQALALATSHHACALIAAQPAGDRVMRFKRSGKSCACWRAARSPKSQIVNLC